MTKEQRQQNALISAVKIKAYSQLINYDYWIGLKDFKSMALISNHSRKIIESANQIELILKQAGASAKDFECSENIKEYTAELWETMDVILSLPLDALKDFNKDLREAVKEK